MCVELVIADGRFNESTGFMNIRKFSISVERRKACFVLEGTILECRKFRFRLTFFVLSESEIFVRGQKSIYGERDLLSPLQRQVTIEYSRG